MYAKLQRKHLELYVFQIVVGLKCCAKGHVMLAGGSVSTAVEHCRD